MLPLVSVLPPEYLLLPAVFLWLLLDYKLCIEEDGRVDDLLDEHEDVEGGAKVGLMHGLCQLLHVKYRGGGCKITVGDS